MATEVILITLFGKYLVFFLLKLNISVTRPCPTLSFIFTFAEIEYSRDPRCCRARHLGSNDVATCHMRRSSIFFAAHRCRFLHRTSEFWSLLRVFLEVFSLIICWFLSFGTRKNTLSKHMDRYSLSAAFFLVLSAWISCSVAFYLPGLAPVSYCEKQSNPACLVRALLVFYMLHTQIS